MCSYDKIYLNSNKKVTKYLFHKFLYSEYDFYQCVKEYMEKSWIRERMDHGNWSALNKGVKQLYNSIGYDSIEKNDNQYMDGILSDWIASIYVHLQWKYEIPSKRIVEVIPPEALTKMYNPLHEASVDVGCDKLYRNFWEGGQKE